MKRYAVDGISVDHYVPETRNDLPPLLFVHGGTHGSWCWENYATFFARRGWDCHALNWFNHGESRKLPLDEFLARSIADVAATEIPVVAERLDRPPILVGHSMGGLASLVYAAQTPPPKLVLITPVVPAAIGQAPAPLPNPDPTQPFGPPPVEVARRIFYPTLSDQEVREHTAKLVAESPQAVYEAVNFSLEVPLERVKLPTFVLSTTLDPLSPAAGDEKLAHVLGAEYLELDDIGHCDVLLKDGEWQPIADRIEQWLRL